MKLELIKAAEGTLKILREGYYIVDGKKIAISVQSDSAVILLPPGWRGNDESKDEYETVTSVTENDTLSALLSRERTDDTLVLNFASPYNPGGGFLSGASAQEESLARSSSLYLSIGGKTASEMYRANRQAKDNLLTDYALYSPSVTFFRDNDGNLLPSPKKAAVLTIPAVDRRRAWNDDEWKIRDEMRRRIQKIFQTAITYNKTDLILGAWGCGVFRNPPSAVAEDFLSVLNDPGIEDSFRNIEFAIAYSKDNAREFRAAFE